MKKIIVFLAILVCFVTSFYYVDGYKIGDDIGDVLSTDIIAQINGQYIPSYNVDNSTAIRVSDLKDYGFDVEWDGKKREVYITRNEYKKTILVLFEKDESIEIGKKLGDILYTDIKTFLNGKQVNSFNMNGNTLIYFRELSNYGAVAWDSINRIASVTLNEAEINLYDKDLEREIRNIVNKPIGKLYRSDIINITELNLQNKGIKNIEGIKEFANLKTLNLNGNIIEDLSPLYELKGIESLQIYYCSDISKAIKVLDYAKEIINEIINPIMSDFEKEIAIHDYIINNCSSDDFSVFKNGKYPEDYLTPYGVFANRLAGDRGYASAAKVLLDLAEVKSEVVQGSKGISASFWNIVRIDGSYYHMNIYRDDFFTVNNSSGMIDYRFFNVADEVMNDYYEWDRDQYPVCNDVDYNYNFRNYWFKHNIEIGKVNTLKGKIYLPSGDKAPKGGLEIYINVSSNSDIFNERLTITDVVYIPEGESEVEYNITAIPNKEGYIISYYYYSFINGYGDPYNDEVKYLNFVYYSKDTVTSISGGAEIIYLLEEDMLVNLPMITGDTISVVISLPDNEKAPKGGLAVRIEAFNNSERYSQYYVIPEGRNSGECDIRVNSSENEYKVTYSIYNNYEGYLNTGYYSVNGTTANLLQTDMVKSSKKIQMSLLRCIYISGTIALPLDVVAPAGGMNITMFAVGSNGTFFTSVEINEGENIVNFKIPVLDKEGEYKVYYVLSEIYNEEYVEFGYYNEKNTVSELDKATNVVADDNSYNVYLEIIGKQKP